MIMSSSSLLFRVIKSMRLTSLFVLAAFLVSCGGGEDRQTKYLERAQGYFDEENYEKARIEVKNVLQINPKNVEARKLFGDIALAEGDVRQAYNNLAAAVDEDPSHIGARLSLAKIFLMVKDYDRVNEQIDEVLELDPQNNDARAIRAGDYTREGQKEKGVELATSVLQSDPGNSYAIGVLVGAYRDSNPEKALQIISAGQQANSDEDASLALMKVSILEPLGRSDEVEAELSKLIDKFPEQHSYSVGLAKFLIHGKRIDEAEATLRRAIELDPEHIDPKLNLIQFLLQQRSKSIAVAETEKLIKESPDEFRFRKTLAQLHLFTGDRDQAIKVLNAIIDRDPKSVGALDARNSLITIYKSEQNRSQVDKLIGEVLDIEPENIPALLERAKIRLTTNDNKGGIADLRAILKNDPESIEATRLLAAALEVDGNFELALDSYRRLLTLRKPDVATYAGAARAAMRVKQYQDAENYVRAALELDSENTSLVTELVKLLALKEDWTTAKSFAERLINSDKSDHLGYFLMGGIDLVRKDNDEAIKNYNKSLDIEPRAIETLVQLSIAHQRRGGLPEAIGVVKAHCAKHSRQSHCPQILGSLLANNRQYDEAIDSFNRSIAMSPKVVSSYTKLAQTYALADRREEAIDALSAGIDETNSRELKVAKANMHQAFEQYEAARDDYLELLKEDPNLTLAKNNLAMLYADYLRTPENLSKARELAADLQEQDSAAVLDTVGWVFYRVGDYQQAITYLQAAVDKIGNVPLLQYHLGMAYYGAGDLNQAQRYLQGAVKSSEPYFGLDEAKSTLEKISK